VSLLVYAIAEGELELLGAHGLDDQPLQGIERDGLTLVVTKHDAPRAAVTEANLRRYEDVVELLMERRTVLPVRFGTTLAEPHESLAVLTEHREQLRTALERVRGAVELGVQGRWRSDQGPGSTPALDERPHPGTAYLNARLASQRRVSEIEERLQPLRDLSQRSRSPAFQRSGLAFSSAYLVPRARVRSFVRLAAELGDELDDIELEVTGPWPPYSFVDGAVA
jgi:Gas vesicle synthesis protein GvpL/GvpF